MSIERMTVEDNLLERDLLGYHGKRDLFGDPLKSVTIYFGGKIRSENSDKGSKWED